MGIKSSKMNKININEYFGEKDYRNEIDVNYDKLLSTVDGRTINLDNNINEKYNILNDKLQTVIDTNSYVNGGTFKEDVDEIKNSLSNYYTRQQVDNTFAYKSEIPGINLRNVPNQFFFSGGNWEIGTSLVQTQTYLNNNIIIARGKMDIPGSKHNGTTIRFTPWRGNFRALQIYDIQMGYYDSNNNIIEVYGRVDVNSNMILTNQNIPNGVKFYYTVVWE